MIKTYEPETKRDIEQVIDVFNDAVSSKVADVIYETLVQFECFKMEHVE